MARHFEIDVTQRAVPSPQWVKDSVDKWDIGREREVGGGVELLVNVKKPGNCPL